MKRLRLFFFALAGLALLSVIVVALAFTPGVQTWAARKLAPSGPELVVDIGHVNAGLNQTRIENIRVVQPGVVLTIPSAEINVDVLDAAGGKVDVKRFVANGWILDLTAPGGAGDSKSSDKVKSNTEPSTASAKRSGDSAKDAFSGLFERVELPFDLAVEGVELTGEVILPEGCAQISITGGGVAHGKEGEFTIIADFKDADAGGIAVRGAVTTRMDTPRTFERFDFVATASATGPRLPEDATLEVSLSAAREGDGEGYVAALRSGGREIFHADVKLPAGAGPATGAWKLDAGSADAAPFTFGQPLPDFVAKGQGAFEADRLFAQIKSTGSLDASIDNLAVLQPEFAALGRLALAAHFDIGTQGDLVRLKTLDVRVSGARPVASVTALQAIEFNAATGVLKAADPESELLRITLDGVPLAWAKPFLGELALTGGDVRGTFVASARDGGFALRPAAPLAIANLSVMRAGEPLLRAVDVSLSAQADYTPKGWTAEIGDLSARSNGVTLFKLTAKAARPVGDNPPLIASGVYEAELPALLAQPVAAGAIELKQGVARGQFTATLGPTRQADFTAELKNLVAADSRSLPSVAIQARAEIDADGRITANAPIVITRAGRKSDLTLEAVMMTVGAVKKITGKLGGDTLHVPDLMLFSSLSPEESESIDSGRTTPRPPPSKQGEPPAAPGPESAPTEPFWAGVTGELTLAFKTLVYSKELQATRATGRITITPTAITTMNLGAVLETGGALRADGRLKFDARKKRPYALKAEVAFMGVEPAPILRALSPGEPSPVKGKFNLMTQLSGRAIQPGGFDESVIGDIHLTSEGGTFKALSVRTSAIVENAGRVAGIAGLIGALAGNESTVKYATRARAAADISRRLGEIRFDRLNVVVGRDKKKNLNIKELTLVSPLIHLTGSGQVTHVPGVSRMRQPLLVNLKLGAKGDLADSLRLLDLLGSEEDNLGYFPMTEELKLDGSLESVGTEQLEELIREALLK